MHYKLLTYSCAFSDNFNHYHLYNFHYTLYFRLESLCINGCQNITDEGLETVLKKHGSRYINGKINKFLVLLISVEITILQFLYFEITKGGGEDDIWYIPSLSPKNNKWIKSIRQKFAHQSMGFLCISGISCLKKDLEKLHFSLD